MLYNASAVSPGERRRAVAALERLGSKLAEREEWRRHGLRVAALKETLDSPLFTHVLDLQHAIAQLRKQLSVTPAGDDDRDLAVDTFMTVSAGSEAPALEAPASREALPTLGAPPSPQLLDQWIKSAAGGRHTEHVRLTRPPSGGLGFSVVGLHPGSGGHGVFVKHVQPGGAAHRDGRLRARDQILTINGHPLEAGVSQHQALALLQQPGGTVQMTVARDRPLPSPLSPASDINTEEWTDVEEIRLVNDGSGLGFGVVGVKNAGVVVRTLVRGGAADRDGRLRTGDRILRIGATPAKGLGSEEAVEALRACGTHVTLLVARDPCGGRAPPPPPPDSAPVVAPPPPPDSTPVVARPPPPDSAPVVTLSPQQARRRPSKTPNLDGYEIHEVALTKQDGQSLGISIIGHNPLSSQDAVGVYIKNVLPGSAAHYSGNIRVQDRLIALDGVSLHGLTNQEVVDVMKGTGRTVVLTLVRKKNGAGVVESSVGSARRSAELKTRRASLDTQNASNGFEADLKAKWQEVLGPNYQVLVIELHPSIQDDDTQLQKSSKLLPVHTHRLGVELDSFDGHHYVSSVVPGGPAERHGVLRPEDELLQVNEARLHGMSRREVLAFLKEAPPPFTLVCCRRTASHAESDGEWEPRGSGLDDLEMKLASALGGRASASPERRQAERAEDAEEEAMEDQDGDDQQEEEEEDGELALWSRSVDVLELSKEAGGGLGFSILDYQDPLDPSGCVMVIRSLVPGGPAELSGALLPGDQLVWVNGVQLARLSLREAVDVLKGAPPGIVRLGVRKPLVGSQRDFSQGQTREEEVEQDEGEGLVPDAQTLLDEGREMAVDEEDEEEAGSLGKAPPSPDERKSFPTGAGTYGDTDADSEVSSVTEEGSSSRMIDTEKRRRRSQGGFATTRKGQRDLPEREEGEGEETPEFSHWGPPRRVEVRAKRGESLGLSIVGGRHVIKRLRNGEELKGIFIKNVVRGSPAATARSLHTGDKILQVSGVDLRAATHEEAVDAIKSAESPVVFVVQSLSTNPRMARSVPPPLREPPPYRPPGQSEARQDRYGDLRGELLRVELSKEAGRGLGLSLAGNPERRGVFVAGLRAGGAAALDGRLRVGDRLLEVNDRVLEGQSHQKASAVIENSASEVKLLLLRPSLYGDGARRTTITPAPPPPESVSPEDASEWPRPPDGDMLRPPSGEDTDPESHEGAAGCLQKNEKGDEDAPGRQVTSASSRQRWNGAGVTVFCSMVTQRKSEGSRGASGAVSRDDDNDDSDDISKGSPATREPAVLPGRETTLEIRKGRSGLGLSVVGGRDTQLRAVVILEVYEDGAAAKDGRLRPGDQILEVNGVDLRRASHQEAISALRRPSSKAVMTVLRERGRRRRRRRQDSGSPISRVDSSGLTPRRVVGHRPLQAVSCRRPDDDGRARSVVTPPSDVTSQEEEEEGDDDRNDREDVTSEDAGVHLRTVHISRGAGDSLGLSIAGGRGSPLGDVPVFIAMIQHHGAAANTQRLKVGDRIVSIDGRSVEAKSHDEVVDMLKETSGNIRLQVVGDTNVAAILSQVENLSSNSTLVNAESDRAHTRGANRRTIVVEKTGEGFGFSVVGGVGSVHGDLPIYVKTVFNKDAADGFPKRGEQVLSVNGESLEGVTHQQAVAILKKHTGSVTLELLS
ncbi:inaD-like protein [Corythoichthys intestinalis]|uniref:inaD-like protein n=1 Tax=Corythoichthys intestinalis TaxID=161448 RepID=UPI0025A572C5|nr:inaD-like protein [Corythoichthys intestinalis]